MAGEGSSKETLTAQTRVWSFALGCIRSMSLMVAVQLGIPDAVHAHGSPISLPDLASAVGIPEAKVPPLRRLMRALSSFGVFDNDVMDAGGEVAYLPTVLSRRLIKDSPTSGAPFVLLGTYPLEVTPWYSMASWLREEGPIGTHVYDVAHGKTESEMMAEVPEYKGVFYDAMACDSRWVVGMLVRQHPEIFRGITSLVDVGGADGATAKAIKEAFPEMRCAVLDFPHVVSAAPAAEGIEFVGGDMFEHIPSANAVLLKWLLHGCSDEDCVRVLQRCKKAIPAKELGGKVIIIELVVRSDGGGGDSDSELVETQLFLDLLMMVSTKGKERDEGEWRRIIATAGFADCKITPALGPRSVIEAYP